MAARVIALDPEADRILTSVADSYGGDPSRAVPDLHIAHQAIEAFLDEFESENSAELVRQRDQAERDFAQGNSIPWAQVKRENGL